MARYNKRHGLYKTKLYRVWHAMKCRCYNPNDKKYPRYGLRGIKVCDEWKNDFVKFNNWANSNGYTEGLSIDRINNDGNYEPSNCRWVTIVENSNNTSKNVFITHNGVTRTISEWSRCIGVSVDAIRWRIKKYGICENVFAPCNTIYRNSRSRLQDISNK